MKKRNKKKGASLILVLLVLAVAMIFSSVTISTISRTTKANVQEKKTEDTLYSAESGLEYAIAWFEKNKTTGVIAVPSVNGCTYDVKVVPDGSNYKIISKATIGGKSRTVTATIEKSGGEIVGGKDDIVITLPVTLMVPGNNSIVYMDGNVERAINNKGINPRYDIRGILNYENGWSIYDIYKDNWGTNVMPTITNKYQGKDSIGIEYATYSLTPFSYITKYVNLPTPNVNGDIVINSSNISKYKDASGNIKVVTNGNVKIFFSNNIELNNATIYANSIDIYGESSNVTFKNSLLVSKLIKTSGSQNRTFDNTKLYADEVKIEGNNNRYFYNGTEINTKTFTVNATNSVVFDKVKIDAESFNVDGSTDRVFTNSEIKVNNFTLNVTNGSNFNNSKLLVGKFIINGSCDKLFDNATITANTFKIASSNVVKFTNSMILSNNFEVTGSTNREFYNSVIISEYMNIESTNEIYFINNAVISKKIQYKANYIKFAITDPSKVEDIFDEAVLHIIVKGSPGEPTPIKYELKNIQYE